MIKSVSVLLMAVLMTACASNQPFVSKVDNPEEEVTRLVELELVKIQSGQFCRKDYPSRTHDCEETLGRLTQLFARYPDYERLQLALAVSNHARNKTAQAQYYLDLLLRKDRPRPEAAILAARLAMENGNTRRAEAILEAQQRLNPTHGGVYETLAAVFYLNHEPQRGFSALAAAERLGAPGWRVAYHRGLMYELAKNESAACEQYAKSYSMNNSFGLPQGRILGLSHNPICLNLANFVGGR